MKEVFILYRKLRERQLKLLNSFTPEELAIIPWRIVWLPSSCIAMAIVVCPHI